MSSLTPIDPRDQRIVRSARHYTAVRYIDTHCAMYLDDQQLLHACATELVAMHNVPDAYAAHAIAAEALAEVQARTSPAWIDISLSTSQVARVIDPVTGQMATFTASELIQIAQERARAIADASPDGEPARPLRSVN